MTSASPRHIHAPEVCAYACSLFILFEGHQLRLQAGALLAGCLVGPTCSLAVQRRRTTCRASMWTYNCSSSGKSCRLGSPAQLSSHSATVTCSQGLNVISPGSCSQRPGWHALQFPGTVLPRSPVLHLPSLSPAQQLAAGAAEPVAEPVPSAVAGPERPPLPQPDSWGDRFQEDLWGGQCLGAEEGSIRHPQPQPNQHRGGVWTQRPNGSRCCAAQLGRPSQPGVWRPRRGDHNPYNAMG